jgi:hypothetical protein
VQIDRRAALAVFALTFGACATTGRVDPNIVSSPARSGLFFVAKVASSFRRLPRITIPIEDKTIATRDVFVEADARGIVRRAVIVQLETVLPSSDFRFRYPAEPPQTLGRKAYRFTGFAFDDARDAAAAPGKEADRTRALLLQQHLKPPRVWQAARLARVADSYGLSEVIVFYLENADSHFAAGPLQNADEDGDAPLDTATKARMLAALRRAVTVAYD